MIVSIKEGKMKRKSSVFLCHKGISMFRESIALYLLSHKSVALGYKRTE